MRKLCSCNGKSSGGGGGDGHKGWVRGLLQTKGPKKATQGSDPWARAWGMREAGRAKRRIWAKVRAKRQPKCFCTVMSLAEAGWGAEEGARGSRQRASGRIWWLKIQSWILVYFFYRHHRMMSNCSRTYENLSSRQFGRAACEKKHMGLDGVLSGGFVDSLASVWGWPPWWRDDFPSSQPSTPRKCKSLGNGIQALARQNNLGGLVKNACFWAPPRLTESQSQQ